MTSLTDPTGPCFVSYKRERAAEAGLLVDALRDYGTPTWQDVSDLPSAPTETSLKRTLDDPATSGAVVLITPEVERSEVIRRVETPRIFAREARADGFFAVPVAAGGLDYGDVDRVLGPMLGLTDLSAYNVTKAPADPFDEAFAKVVARRVLRERLDAIQRSAAPGEPFILQVSTRAGLPKKAGVALRVDMTHRFEGRHARLGAWDAHVLPAFRTIAEEVARRAPGRRLDVTGYPSLPAAVAVGAALPSLGPVRAGWLQEQTKFGAPTERWSLDGAGEDCGFVVDVRGSVVGASDLALLVSATNDVVHDFTLSRTGLSLRAMVHLAPREPRPARLQLTSGQARDLACRAVDAVREAVAEFRARGTIHLFLAAPAGVAFMLGQQLNTLGRVQTYEHDPAGATPYLPAALLTPSN